MNIIESEDHNRGISVYDAKNESGNQLKNTGYDYSNTLYSKNSSGYIFRNTKVAGYIQYLNNIMFEYVETVKKIRVYYNYTVKKDYRKIN